MRIVPRLCLAAQKVRSETTTGMQKTHSAGAVGAQKTRKSYRLEKVKHFVLCELG
jgi:hypothetical protein